MRTPRYRRFLASLAFLAFATPASADDASLRVVVVTAAQIRLSEELEVLADPTGTLRIDQVAASGALFGKPPVTGAEITRHQVYWVRFKLTNPGAAPQTVFIDPGSWNDARLFTRSDTGFQEQRSGLLLPVAQRSVRMATIRTFSFLLQAELLPSDISTFYLRVESDYRVYEPASFRLIVSDGPSLRASERNILFYQGLFLGTILALCLYNLVLFLRIRDASYGYYVLFLVGIWIIWAHSYNLTVEWLWPAWPTWEFYGPMLAQEAIIVGLTQFTRRYLDTPRSLPRFDIALRIMLATQLLPLVALPFAKYGDAKPCSYFLASAMAWSLQFARTNGTKGIICSSGTKGLCSSVSPYRINVLAGIFNPI